MKRIIFVCSNGGHLLQLLQAEKFSGEGAKLWITIKKADSESLLSSRDCRWAYFPTNRNLWNLVRNTAQALRIFLTFKPTHIISTGAGLAIPYFLFGFLLRTKTCYIESFARVDTPSLTGKVCKHFASTVLYQWESLASHYPKGKYAGSLY